MSHDLLDELLADVPRYVAPDVDAAWRAGTRRRRRRVAAWGAAGISLALISGIAALGYEARRSAEPADSPNGIERHPSFVPRPLLVQDLPSRPGPVAGVLVTDVSGTIVVDGDGRSWRMPDAFERSDFVPALSADGRRLGFMERVSDQTSQYVIADLVTGERTEFPEVGDNIGESTQTYMMYGQTPSFWSPDGRWIMTFGTLSDGASGLVLLGSSGEVRLVPDHGWPVGWIGNNRLGWLKGRGVLLVTDLEGVVQERVVLEPPSGEIGQWSGRLSPDGSMLAVIPFPGTEGVTIYDARSGQVTGQGEASGALFSPPVWAGDSVGDWTDEGVIDVSTGEFIVEYSTHWPDVVGGQWASDALEGDESAGPGLFAWQYWQWLWWWQTILVGLAVVAVLLTVRWLIRLDRRRVE